MSSNDDATALDADDPPDPPRVYPLVAATTMYSYSSKDFVNTTTRSKRRQVKNACTNCQKACKKCDDARPCLRCVKYGVSEECVDSKRKERKKGIKRGPYKKRDGKGSNVETPPGSAPVSSSGSLQPPGHILPIGYPPPGYYPPMDKTPDPPVIYGSPQYFLAALPPGHHPHQDSQLPDHLAPFQGFYQAAVYHHHPPYLMPRNNIQAYPIYPSAVLQKLPPYDERNGLLPEASGHL